jgi:hypothetical protein
MQKKRTLPFSKEWLEDNLYEDNDRDFKRELNYLSSTEELFDLIRHCAALCNYGGGSLVIGVEQNQVLGKFDVVGVPEGKIHSDFDSTRIMQQLNKYCSPSVHITTHMIDTDKGKVLIINVGGAELSPVLIKKVLQDKNGKTFIREGSIFTRWQHATIVASSEEQIRPVLENIIYQRVQIEVSKIRHSLSLLGINPEAVSGEEIKENKVSVFESNARKWLLSETKLAENKSRREFLVYPVDDIHISNLKDIISIDVECNTWPFPFYAENAPPEKVTNTKISNGYAHAFRDIDGILGSYHRGFQLLDNGYFFWLGSLQEQSYSERGETRFVDAVGVMTTQIYLSCCLIYLKEILPLIEYDGKWQFVHRIVNVKNKRLIVDDPMRVGFMTERTCHEDNISIETQFTKEELLQDIEKIAVRLCADIYQMFNWHNPNIGQLEKDIASFHQKVRRETVHVFSH